jgi:hypothetical protein
MRKTLTKCPACNNQLHISEYSCSNCGTSISGKFELDELFRLSEDQLFFVKIFLKNRGNLSEVQKELEISYPTARNRLENIVRAMGFEGAQPERTESQKILDMLETGEISSKEAMEMLRAIKKGDKK